MYASIAKAEWSLAGGQSEKGTHLVARFECTAEIAARNYIAYEDPGVQEALNQAWNSEKSSLTLNFPTMNWSPVQATINFETFLVTYAWNETARALQLTDEMTSEVILSHDLLCKPVPSVESVKSTFEETGDPRDAFGENVDAYHYWSWYDQGLLLEFPDPAA